MQLLVNLIKELFLKFVLHELKFLLRLFVTLLRRLLGFEEVHGQPSDKLAGVTPEFSIEVALHDDDALLLVTVLEDASCVLLRPQDPILEDPSGTNDFIVSIDDHRYLLGRIQLCILELKIFLL